MLFSSSINLNFLYLLLSSCFIITQKHLTSHLLFHRKSSVGLCSDVSHENRLQAFTEQQVCGNEARQPSSVPGLIM